jgi:CSLREA domain-containing protein
METAQYDLTRLRRTLLVLALILAVAGLATLVWQLWAVQTVRAVGPYVVNSTNDDADATAQDGLCQTANGECTLRAAIEQANADGVATTINFIATGTITLSSDLPIISIDLSINGPGADRLTIHGADSYRPFYISSGRTVVISGLTLTRGRSSSGGAIYNSMGTLTVDTCTVSYNTASGVGGGIYNYGGALVIKASTLSSNTSSSSGGGIYNSMGNMTIEASAISGNLASYYGGGVYSGNGGLTIKASIISSNVASNTASGGGGLYLSYSSADLTNNIVTDNRADGAGSGIYISGAAPRLWHTTIARNIGGDGSGVYVTGSSTPALTNTILVNQRVGITAVTDSMTTLDGVLWYGNALNTGGAGAVIVLNPYTGNPAFAVDGYHLTAGSMAIDRGIHAGITTDIDGEPRDAAPDLGADEYRSGPGESRTRVDPGLGGLLIYADTRGLTTTVQFPPGAVPDATDVVYTAIPSPTEPISPGLRLAGLAFDLNAYRNGELVPGITFSGVATVTIHYADADVRGIFEDTLRLYRWVPPTWEVVGIRRGEGQAPPDTVNNVLTAWLRGLSKFGELGIAKYDIFLPTVIRNG